MSVSAAVITTGRFSSSWYAWGNSRGFCTKPSSSMSVCPPYHPFWYLTTGASKLSTLLFIWSWALDSNPSIKYTVTENTTQTTKAFRRTRMFVVCGSSCSVIDNYSTSVKTICLRNEKKNELFTQLLKIFSERIRYTGSRIGLSFMSHHIVTMY